MIKIKLTFVRFSSANPSVSVSGGKDIVILILYGLSYPSKQEKLKFDQVNFKKLPFFNKHYFTSIAKLSAKPSKANLEAE